MKPRIKPLAEPTSPRWWQTPQGIWMRFPGFEVAVRLQQLYAGLGAAAPADTVGELNIATARLLPRVAAVVGCCWYDLTRELDTPRPNGSPESWTDDALLAYGSAVSDELQDVWAANEILSLFSATWGPMAARLHATSYEEVKKRVDFTVPPQEAPSGV